MSKILSHRTVRVLAIAGATASFALAACGGDETPPPAMPAPAGSTTVVPAAPVASAAPVAPPPAADQPLTDEGMWLTNDFPADKVAKQYGFTPTQEWLDHVRLSSVRLAGGCSGSLVSANGLVMTNHHCAHSCIEQLSNAKKDFVKEGFFAKTGNDEVKCPEIEVNQLTGIDDVSARVQDATKGLADKALNDAQRAVTATIEKECATGDNVRCDVVNLYHGGRYHLYKYRRYQDVRLVFAPEIDIAFFGGDPDNFNFPRFDLDVSFLRVYDGGKPLAPKDYLKWSEAGAKDGELTFVSGHPGRTSRQLTVAQLEFERDYALPRRLFDLDSYEGTITQFMKEGPEKRRVAEPELFYVQNSIKALEGEREALVDAEFLHAKAHAEHELREKAESTPELAQYKDAWKELARIQGEKAALQPRFDALSWHSSLFGIARGLVRAADELPKPNDKRLDEFGDARIPGTKQRLFSAAPVSAELETLKLSRDFVRMRQLLGADDPVVKKVLGKDDAYELAAKLVKGTKLADVKVRKALFDGGAAAVSASTDPLIQLAKLVDADARAVRTQWEEHIVSPEKKFGEEVARAKFAIYGTHVYPDATFSLRLSYGHVAGWMENGKQVPAFTTFGGACDRATGKPPFELPKSWIAAKSKLDLSTPFDMATTNDIIGGNSGSPMVNKNAEVVGLIFDGNIHSLGGEYGFEPKNNRAVAVTSVALTEALGKVYGATRVVDELKGKK